MQERDTAHTAYTYNASDSCRLCTKPLTAFCENEHIAHVTVNPRDTPHVQMILPTMTVYDALGKSTVNEGKVNEVLSNYDFDLVQEGTRLLPDL